MTDIVTPAQIESAIRDCSNRLARSIPIRTERLTAKRAAERDYRRAFDRVYMSAEGSIDDRKTQARMQTEDLHDAVDVAEVVYKEAEALARSIEKELDALRSVGASLRTTYLVAGRGE